MYEVHKIDDTAMFIVHSSTICNILEYTNRFFVRISMHFISFHLLIIVTSAVFLHCIL